MAPAFGCVEVRRARRSSRALGAAVALAAACAAAPCRADSQQLADLSLEQLRDVVVQTVSRYDEPLDRAAASVYVITAEDIRRSGATTLPEALRLAPTLDVARADANQYAISARGFNNVLANKMLVLIDSRTVYTPLFSGVFWEAQDVLLDDVERIEVVTGPSTALWGSNAVNGMIHVFTKSAHGTRGWLADAHAGNQERGAVLRRGQALGELGDWRWYAKTYDRSDTSRADGTSVYDRANGLQAGFRGDWTRRGSEFTIQGDAYQGEIQQPNADARHFSGANLLARWNRRFSGGVEANAQAYLDHTQRDHPQVFSETLDTADIVGQVGFYPAAGHHVLLGGGLRHSRDAVTNFQALAFYPPTRDMTWSRLFLQDQAALSHHVTLTLAGSAETNPFTRAEFLPGARIAWNIDSRRMAWAALSRAVRAPSRVDREFFQPAQAPYVLAGGPDFDSEVSNVLELGWRAQPDQRLSYSISLFRQQHRGLRATSPSPDGLQFVNGFDGFTDGAEAWMRWRIRQNWRLDGGFTALHENLHVRPGVTDVTGVQALGNDPRQWWSVRSTIDLTPRHLWDVSIRHVAARPHPDVPAYTAVDTRLAWQATPSVELALVVENLLDPSHAEWGVATNRIEVERRYLLQLRWRP